jgi:hypothetical protein
MPLGTHGEIPYSITDAKVYPYSGGSAGAAKDVPGIRRVEISAQVEEAEHRGDNTVLAVAASISSFDLTVEVGQQNLDAIAAMAGGTVTTSGTTPNQTRTLSRTVSNSPADFALKATAPSKSADGGSVVLELPRCQWVGGPNLSLADNEFPATEISARAVADGSSVLYKLIQYEGTATLS